MAARFKIRCTLASPGQARFDRPCGSLGGSVSQFFGCFRAKQLQRYCNIGDFLCQSWPEDNKARQASLSVTTEGTIADALSTSTWRWCESQSKDQILPSDPPSPG